MALVGPRRILFILNYLVARFEQRPAEEEYGVRADAGVGSRLLDAACEVATALMLLPTAALGATIRLVLQLIGKESLVQFGPPPQREPEKKASPSD